MNDSKLPLRIVNRTNYFIPGKDRTHITISSPYSWRYITAKREGYEQRLYWEYKFTQRYGGQTFFYTLTYNNRSIPKDPWLNRPCFDYYHLKELFEGSFRKTLLREYGSTFRYFVGSELGEGAGSRGYARNPHYHILLFVRSAQKLKYPFKPITEEQMTHLLRMHWQGYDQNKKYDGWTDYRKFRYGIVKEGALGAVVSGKGDACFYCAKYCCKDASIRTTEFKIKRHFEKLFSKQYDDKNKVKELVDEKLKLFRNRYSNKVRISQGVGWSSQYAKEIIPDFMNPYVRMPGKYDWDPQGLSLFYYRKLYTQVRKDFEGNNIYVLNDLGIAYRKHHLKHQLQQLEDDTFTNLLVLNPKVYEAMLFSDCNENGDSSDVTMSYTSFRTLLNHFNPQTVVKRYAEYKLVYENRWFKVKGERLTSSYSYPDIDVFRDFGEFIVPSFFKGSYDKFACINFINSGCEGFSSYISHPYFCLYRSLFAVFDLLATYFFIQGDELAESKAKEIEEIKRYHNSVVLESFYNNFLIPNYD